MSEFFHSRPIKRVLGLATGTILLASCTAQVEGAPSGDPYASQSAPRPAQSCTPEETQPPEYGATLEIDASGELLSRLLNKNGPVQFRNAWDYNQGVAEATFRAEHVPPHSTIFVSASVGRMATAEELAQAEELAARAAAPPKGELLDSKDYHFAVGNGFPAAIHSDSDGASLKFVPLIPTRVEGDNCKA
jgi:hypothetical protein